MAIFMKLSKQASTPAFERRKGGKKEGAWEEVAAAAPFSFFL